MLEILPWGNDFHGDDDVCSLSHNRMALPPKSKLTHYIERTKIGILLSITSVQLLAFHFPFWHVHHPKLSVNISVESERSQWQQHKILVTWLTWKRSRSTGPPSTWTLPRCKRLYLNFFSLKLITPSLHIFFLQVNFDTSKHPRKCKYCVLKF